MNTALLLNHEPNIVHGFIPATLGLLLGMSCALCHDMAIIGVKCMATGIELAQQAVFHCTEWLWERGL